MFEPLQCSGVIFSFSFWQCRKYLGYIFFFQFHFAWKIPSVWYCSFFPPFRWLLPHKLVSQFKNYFVIPLFFSMKLNFGGGGFYLYRRKDLSNTSSWVCYFSLIQKEFKNWIFWVLKCNFFSNDSSNPYVWVDIFKLIWKNWKTRLQISIIYCFEEQILELFLIALLPRNIFSKINF